MCSTGGHTNNVVRGFPIRTSWDQRPVIDSPRLIADSHVLHRLLLPRHPPCALKNLATQGQALNEHPPPSPKTTRQDSKDDYILGATTHHQGAVCDDNKNKMLASTMQFPNNNPHHTPTPPTPPNESAHVMLQRGRNQDQTPQRRSTRINHPPHPTTHPKACSRTAGSGRSCCPRTQQCAKTPIPPDPVIPLPHAGATPQATPRAPIPSAQYYETTSRYDQGTIH